MQLSSIAEEEPQLAYCAYTKAMCMRWCFLQRTVPNTKEYFAPLEETIRETLIPTIIGRKVTDIERRIIALPVRLGGLGIQNPMETAEREFQNSNLITQNLTDLIKNQESDLNNYDGDGMKEIVARLKLEKEESMNGELENIKTLLNENDRRTLELIGEKGAGAWLNIVPIQSTDYALNKEEFRDALRLRYDWKIPGTPPTVPVARKTQQTTY